MIAVHLDVAGRASHAYAPHDSCWYCISGTSLMEMAQVSHGMIDFCCGVQLLIIPDQMTPNDPLACPALFSMILWAGFRFPEPENSTPSFNHSC